VLLCLTSTIRDAHVDLVFSINKEGVTSNYLGLCKRGAIFT
jgi:hypothetical protein